MDKLSQELLLEIFGYLKFNELCQLTLTCKTFNEIISNNSTLMDKFRLVYTDDEDINYDSIKKRKYQRIVIETVDEDLIDYLKYYGDNICAIIFDRNKFELRKLKKILNICSNLKQLHFDYRCCINDEFIEPLSKLSIDSFCVSHFREPLRISTDKNEKLLELRSNSICESFLLKFLKNQKQLKKLEIVDARECNKLFDNDSLGDVDFQLETFVFGSKEPYFNVDNFKKFMRNQKGLRKFIIDPCSNPYNSDNNFEYADILNESANIEELIVAGVFREHKPMPHIEILSIDINYNENVRDFQKLFPNVKSLSFDGYSRIKFVKNLPKSDVRDMHMYEIHENVKTLTMKCVRSGNDGLFDEDVDIKIENLIIYKSDSIHWLIECFKNDRMKLKSLTVEGTKMKTSQQEYLESLTQGDHKKIEKLKIYMPMEFDENDDYDFDYYMEDEDEDDGAKRMKLE